MSERQLVRPQDSLISGVINALINGVIAYYSFKPLAEVPIALDSQPLGQVSVWGQSVGMALGLALLLTLITAPLFLLTVKKADPALRARLHHPWFPNLIGLGLRHMALMGAAIWLVGLVWNWAGGAGMALNLVNASLLVAALAGLVAFWTELQTKRALLK